MKKQYIKALIEKAVDGGFSFIASTAAVDRQGDVIDQGGWDIASYLKNPVMLWAHDYTLPPVAKALTINPTDPRGLTGTCEFAPTDFAQEIKTLVEGGFVNALSVGFIPKERNGNTITSSELLEISFVPVPANQEALMLAAKALTDTGIAQDRATEIVAKFLSLKAEAPAPEAEAKGPVSDEIDAEEAYEAKWEKMDEFFEVVGAVCDVYFDENTPVEAFSSLMLEAAGLITALAQNDGEDDDDQEDMVQMASYAKLVKKSIGVDSKKALARLVEKIGARHSAQTKGELQKAKDFADQASAVLGALIDASTEDGTTEGADEPTDAEKAVEAVISGKDAARALLEVRGVLRERTGGDQTALSIINRHLAGRD